MDPALRQILLVSCCVALVLILCFILFILPMLRQAMAEKKELGRKQIRRLLDEIEEMKRGDREATEESEATHWNPLAPLMREHGFTPRDFDTSWAVIKDKMVIIDHNRRAGLRPQVRKAGVVLHAGIERQTHRTRGERVTIEPVPVKVFPRPQVVVGNGGVPRESEDRDLKRARRPQATLVGMQAVRVPTTARTSRSG